MTQPFYMVYLEGSGAPTYKHITFESAETEAKRLAKAHRSKAYVLCSVKSFEVNEFSVVDLRPSFELPF